MFLNGVTPMSHLCSITSFVPPTQKQPGPPIHGPPPPGYHPYPYPHAQYAHMPPPPHYRPHMHPPPPGLQQLGRQNSNPKQQQKKQQKQPTQKKPTQSKKQARTVHKTAAGAAANANKTRVKQASSARSLPTNASRTKASNAKLVTSQGSKKVPQPVSSTKWRVTGVDTGGWSKEEDETLAKAVEEHGAKSWKFISGKLANRTDLECQHRWRNVLKPSLIRGGWTPEEDAELVRLVGLHGTKNWSDHAAQIPGRLGKQCRERWVNHLDPNVNLGAWSAEEDRTILEFHNTVGNKWCEMSKVLPGR